MENENGSRTFTSALESLRKAADQIGRPSVSLEEAMELYNSGMRDAEYCREILDKAEQKIEIYRKGEEDDQNL